MNRSRLLLGGAALALAWLVGAQEIPFPSRRKPSARPAAARACGCAHACGPATYQGCGCGSLSCFPGGGRLKSIASDARAATALASLQAPAACVAGLAVDFFPCRSIALQSSVTLRQMHPSATTGSNLWGFVDSENGREYGIVGLSSGTAVVEVTDPAHPRIVGSVDGPESLWREVKVLQVAGEAGSRRRVYAYVVSEAPTAGLQILDLSGLPDRVTLAATLRAFDTAHTITLANVDPSTGIADPGGPAPLLYVQGARQPTVGIFALDVSNPVEPAVLGEYRDSYGHDTWAGRISGERARGCLPGHDPCDLVVVWTGQDIRALDWTEKASPAIIARITYPELGYAHSGWISRDGNYLFSMDELDERATGRPSRVRVFDVSDWSRPSLAGQWQGTTTAIEHNGYTVGDLYYMAHYARGLTILDVANPLNPFEAAFFDTFPENDIPEYHGSWGVYPFLPSGTILLSNLDGAGGLFLLQHTPASGDSPRNPIAPLSPRARTPRVVDAPPPIP